MKKLCLALVVAFTLLAPAAVTADPVTSTVRVSVRKIDNDRGFAAGVVIIPGIVLTAHHVAINEKLRIEGGKIVGEVIALGNGTTLDIAILRYPAEEARCPCARLADHPALLDEKVWVVGYPFNIGQIVTTGTAQGTREVSTGKRLVLTAAVAQGNSGGGVFVYRDGAFQLVGILVEGMGNQYAANISLAIPLEDLKAFIAEHQGKF